MRNPEVDAWFEKRQPPQEAAMQAVQAIALDADEVRARSDQLTAVIQGLVRLEG